MLGLFRRGVADGVLSSPSSSTIVPPSVLSGDVYVVGFFRIEGSGSSRSSCLGKGVVDLGIEGPVPVRTTVGGCWSWEVGEGLRRGWDLYVAVVRLRFRDARGD